MFGITFASIYRRIIYSISRIPGFGFLRHTDGLFSAAKSLKSKQKTDKVNREYAMKEAEMKAEVADVADGSADISGNDEARFRQFLKSYNDMIHSIESSKPGISEVKKMKEMLASFEEQWNSLDPGDRAYDDFMVNLDENGDMKKFNELYAEAEVKRQR